VPRLVAAVLTRRLHREVSVADCGFVDHEPVAAGNEGLRWSSACDGTMSNVVELSGRDLRRRNFLLGSTFTASAFAEPALLALTAPPTLAAARVGAHRIGMSDVAAINATTEHFERLVHQLGGRVVREQVVRFLHGEASRALNGKYTGDTGRALFSAVAEAARQAAFVSIDAGRPALGQRYYIQAFNLTMHADDRLMAAATLACMGRLTLTIGQGSTVDAEVECNGRYAVALVRTARSIVTDPTPLLATRLYAVEARGLVLLGDATGTSAAADEARRALDRADPEHESLAIPFWGDYTEPLLFTDIGQGLRDAGRVNQATAMFEQSIRELPPWRADDRAMAEADLAMTYLANGDLDATLAAAGTAITSAESLASQRVLDRLAILQRRLAPHLKHRPLAAANHRLTELQRRTQPADPTDPAP
jgi:hypothetical protein